MMPTMESTARICTMVTFTDAFGTRGSEKRMNPYVPIFNSTLARITDPAVGASTCASGSQVWNGNIGTLMANPMKNAQNTHFDIAIHSSLARGPRTLMNSGMSKVYGLPVTRA